ncbi:MAG: ion channel [Gammaproteobacteria bacterium]|nr:ion channel [Gammaproteobacteria bacterium]
MNCCVISISNADAKAILSLRSSALTCRPTTKTFKACIGATKRRHAYASARLNNARLRGADLTGASPKGATLLSAEFSDANISGIQFNETEACRDIRINTALGNALFKRYAQDQPCVEEYNFTYPLRHALWKYSSNRGRSLSLWVFWCVFIAVGFSLDFHFHLGGSESFVLNELAKETGYHPRDWAPMLYYSVVTFTTLGFGDIVPKHRKRHGGSWRRW